MTTETVQQARTPVEFQSATAFYGAPPRVTHRDIHRVPQAGCPWCPPTPCVCGVMGCPHAEDHRFASASAETSWREVPVR